MPNDWLRNRPKHDACMTLYTVDTVIRLWRTDRFLLTIRWQHATRSVYLRTSADNEWNAFAALLTFSVTQFLLFSSIS